MKNSLKLVSLLALLLVFIGCSSDGENTTPALYWNKVAAGDWHTLAIRSDGTLWAWGRNFSGQLGDGTFEERLSPVQIGTDDDWKDVYGGQAHSAALKKNGKLYAWGNNSVGQVGNNSYDNQNVPAAIGTETWNQIALGDLSSVGLRTDGTLWAWGANFYGQVGTDESDGNYQIPKQVGNDDDWIFIASGAHHALAKKSNGDLWGWGESLIAELLIIENDLQFTPIQITSGAQHNWVTFTGHYHNILMKSDGKIYGWGSNLYSELGNPSLDDPTTTIAPIGNDSWKIIDAASNTSAGIKTNGSLWLWGRNSDGQLGLGNLATYETPTQIGADSDWKFVTTGSNHGLALKNSNELWSWGLPNLIGNGFATGSNIPVAIPCPQ